VGGARKSSSYDVKFIAAFLFAPKFAPQNLENLIFNFLKNLFLLFPILLKHNLKIKRIGS